MSTNIYENFQQTKYSKTYKYMENSAQIKICINNQDLQGSLDEEIMSKKNKSTTSGIKRKYL